MDDSSKLSFWAGGVELHDGSGTQVVGILNATPDSFSDGGSYPDLESALTRGLEFVEAGASMIDVGGLSTRPGSKPVSEAEEIDRTAPLIEALRARTETPISIDTYRAGVFRAAVQAGATVLNDVSAFSMDEELAEALGATDAGVVLMHMLGEPATMQDNPVYSDVVADVSARFAAVLEVCERFGIDKRRVALDPGIGFGKTLEHNLELLRRVEEFKVFGCALYLGTSRKSFLGKILDRPVPLEREYGTAATTAFLHAAGVQFLRVHNVQATVDVVRVLDAIRGPRR